MRITMKFIPWRTDIIGAIERACVFSKDQGDPGPHPQGPCCCHRLVDAVIRKHIRCLRCSYRLSMEVAERGRLTRVTVPQLKGTICIVWPAQMSTSRCRCTCAGVRVNRVRIRCRNIQAEKWLWKAKECMRVFLSIVPRFRPIVPKKKNRWAC